MSGQFGVPRRPVVLVILDGFGLNPSRIGNAIAQARTPRLDEYFFRYPFTVLNASGHGVGLPDGQIGNSEVGHLTIGSGCLVRQDLVLIDDAIADGSLFANVALTAAIRGAAYAAGSGDGFIHPTVIGGYKGLAEGDTVISFNFRKDRPRQIVAALAEKAFAGFDRGDAPLAAVTCMMEYESRLGLPFAFTPEAPAVADTVVHAVEGGG